MQKNRFKTILIAFGLIAIVLILFIFNRQRSAATVPQATLPRWTAIPIPKAVSISDSQLKDSVTAAGDYLVRQQLSNGELSYQVDILTQARNYSPSYVRLIAGTGALYTVCRISDDTKYCTAGDLALDHYLEQLVVDPQRFAGACIYTTGTCQLGGSALAVDAIYKRWQATGSLTVGDWDLLTIAKNLGYFIVSMRKPEGGFYHAFDPYYAGTVDPDYFVIYFPGESLLALMELYEMTGNQFWLTQAREVDDFMITQPVTEDHWHSYALSMFARLDELTQADKDYAKRIADTVIAGQVRSLNPNNTSISTATKIESLAALAQAFRLSNEEYEWLDPEIQTFITFVRARQLPQSNCSWNVTEEMMENFNGGIFSNCDEPYIRVDGLQHYINGITAYLEYLHTPE